MITKSKVEFNPNTFDYSRFMGDNFEIVDKTGVSVPLKANSVQTEFEKDKGNDAIILKARQQGFSSWIDGIFTSDFILRSNSYGAIVADIEDNAVGLLDRIKYYLGSYEEKNKTKLQMKETYIKGNVVDLKYDSRFELYHEFMNSRLVIGTAKNVEFGRSKTITNLHLSEIAFYPNIEKILAGAGQAVVQGGRKWLETTANGFNEFKELWDDSSNKFNNYKALFYGASKFYSKEFLEMKKREFTKRGKVALKYYQEYPDNPIEAFISSGDCYFDQDSLRFYLEKWMSKPMVAGYIY